MQPAYASLHRFRRRGRSAQVVAHELPIYLLRRWMPQDDRSVFNPVRLIPRGILSIFASEDGVLAVYRISNLQRVVDPHIADHDRRGHYAAVDSLLQARLALKEADRGGLRSIKRLSGADYLNGVQLKALILRYERNRYLAYLAQSARLVDSGRLVYEVRGRCTGVKLSIEKTNHHGLSGSRRRRRWNRDLLDPSGYRRSDRESVGSDLHLPDRRASRSFERRRLGANRRVNAEYCPSGGPRLGSQKCSPHESLRGFPWIISFLRSGWRGRWRNLDQGASIS